MRNLAFFLSFFFLFTVDSYSLPKCEGEDNTKWTECFGTIMLKTGSKYVGELKDGKGHGKGTDRKSVV